MSGDQVAAEMAAKLKKVSPPLKRQMVEEVIDVAFKRKAHFKWVVHAMEKYMQSAKSNYRVPALFLINAIVQKSQEDPDTDVYTERFQKNLQWTIKQALRCSAEDQDKVKKLVGRWQERGVFPSEVCETLIPAALRDEENDEEDDAEDTPATKVDAEPPSQPNGEVHASEDRVAKASQALDALFAKFNDPAASSSAGSGNDLLASLSAFAEGYQSTHTVTAPPPEIAQPKASGAPTVESDFTHGAPDSKPSTIPSIFGHEADFAPTNHHEQQQQQQQEQTQKQQSTGGVPTQFAMSPKHTSPVDADVSRANPLPRQPKQQRPPKSQQRGQGPKHPQRQLQQQQQQHNMPPQHRMMHPQHPPQQFMGPRFPSQPRPLNQMAFQGPRMPPPGMPPRPFTPQVPMQQMMPQMQQMPMQQMQQGFQQQPPMGGNVPFFPNQNFGPPQQQQQVPQQFQPQQQQQQQQSQEEAEGKQPTTSVAVPYPFAWASTTLSSPSTSPLLLCRRKSGPPRMKLVIDGAYMRYPVVFEQLLEACAAHTRVKQVSVRSAEDVARVIKMVISMIQDRFSCKVDSVACYDAEFRANVTSDAALRLHSAMRSLELDDKPLSKQGHGTVSPLETGSDKVQAKLHLGTTRGHSIECVCGHVNEYTTQFEVDVELAMGICAASLDKDVDGIAVFAGDGDLAEAFSFARDMAKRVVCIGVASGPDRSLSASLMPFIEPHGVMDLAALS
eukprot:m.208595 g.208595  ORF g.208595 m.208595 type:complete len:727 (+) comp15043_c3_seq1:221-2401(+)